MNRLALIAGWLARESGIRFLAQRRASAAVAILAIALAVGGNALAFAMARGFLLSGLAMPEPDRIFVIAPVRELPGRGDVVFAEAYANYARLREVQRSFADVTVLRQASAGYDLGDGARPIQVAYVSASFFPTTRAQPAIGRAFRVEEEGPNAARVVLVSDALWRTAFAADPAVLGRTMIIDGIGYTVIGVMPAGFAHPLRTDVWLPFDLDSPNAWTAVTGARSLTVYGRLKDGTSRKAAETEMEDLTRLALEATADNLEFRYTLQRIRDVLVPNGGRVLTFVQLGAALLFFLAIANLAALLIAWGFSRQQEMAVRLALGAARKRVVLTLVMQSVVVVALGGILGLVLTWFLLPMVRAVDVPLSLRFFIDEMRVDWLVLLAAIAAMLVAGIMAGLLPAILVRRTDLVDGLRATGRTITLSVGAVRWQKAMVVLQASLSLVIVFVAVLVGVSLRNLTRVPLGFVPGNSVVARVQLGARYAAQVDRAAFGNRLLENLDRESDLDAFGFTSTLPVGDPGWGGRFLIDPADAASGAESLLFHIRRISDRYPETMGMPLLEGRLFDSRDRADGAPVALVSRSAAQRLWPGESAVGKHLFRVRVNDTPEALEIVGVLGDVFDGGLTAPAGEAVYVHWQQISVQSMSIVARSSAGEATALSAIQRALTATDGIMAANNTATLQSLVDQANALPRLQTILLGGFATIAVALLLLGAYGVMTQMVASREREFALRLLFGAPAVRLGASVLGQISLLGLIGTTAGATALWTLDSLLEPLVFGIAPRSVSLLITTVLAVLLLGLLASFVPAFRAMRIDVRRGVLP